MRLHVATQFTQANTNGMQGANKDAPRDAYMQPVSTENFIHID